MKKYKFRIGHFPTHVFSLFSFRQTSVSIMMLLLMGAIQKKSLGQTNIPVSETNKPGSKVLFSIDDQSIPWKKNLQLTMVKPDKYPGNPVVRRGGKGSVDEWAVQYYGSVIYDEGKFKMWYIAADSQDLKHLKDGRHGFSMHPAYAESQDGINWIKPNLGLVEYNNSKQNNLVKIDPPSASTAIHLIVIHEPDDPKPDRRYKMMLTVAASLGDGEGRGKGSTSIVLFSADGLNWKSGTPLNFDKGFLLEKNLVLPPINFEQGGLFRWEGIYHLCGQVFSPTIWQPDGKLVGRVMTILRSRDLLQWDSTLSFSFIRNGMGGKTVPVGEGEEAHIGAAIWNRGNVLLGLYGMWHGAAKWQSRSMDLGLIISDDGIYFREPVPDYVLIDKGNEGEWDQGGLIQGQGFANVGDKTYIWYGAWDMKKPSYPPRGGVGLVTLRRDGFGYLSAKNKDEIANFVTRIIKKSEIPSGHLKLLINVEGVSREAPILVELLDKTGLPIPGYSGKNAALVTDDGLSREIEWGGNKIKKSYPLKDDFSVKITYPKNSKAQVYALYLENGR